MGTNFFKKLFSRGRSKKQIIIDSMKELDVALYHNETTEGGLTVSLPNTHTLDREKTAGWTLPTPPEIKNRRSDLWSHRVHSEDPPFIVGPKTLEALRDHPDFLPNGFKGPVELIDALGVPKQVMDHIGLWTGLGGTTWLDRAYKLGLRDMEKMLTLSQRSGYRGGKSHQTAEPLKAYADQTEKKTTYNVDDLREAFLEGSSGIWEEDFDNWLLNRDIDRLD